MNFKNFINNTLTFFVKRLIELIGLIIIFFSIFLLISLISYSADDPNFIFDEKTKISNLMGFRGSYTSDLILQSFGIISYLYPFTFLFMGITLINNKKLIIVIENLFFLILYTIFGSLYFNIYSNLSFELSINGNGGFLGNFASELLNLNFIIAF